MKALLKSDGDPFLVPIESPPQLIAAELLNAAASSDAGRTIVGRHVADNGVQRLMQSSVFGARVAAASAFTKLGLAAKVGVA